MHWPMLREDIRSSIWSFCQHLSEGHLHDERTIKRKMSNSRARKGWIRTVKRSVNNLKDQISEDILTVRELALYLRVHATTIYRLLRENQIPAFRVGSDWRFSRRAIDHWMLSQQK